ncbi:hypothetical protein D3C81_1831580 [compost metagenome]
MKALYNLDGIIVKIYVSAIGPCRELNQKEGSCRYETVWLDYFKFTRENVNDVRPADGISIDSRWYDYLLHVLRDRVETQCCSDTANRRAFEKRH